MKLIFFVIPISILFGCIKYRPKNAYYQFYTFYTENGIKKDSIMTVELNNTRKRAIILKENLNLNPISYTLYDTLFTKGTKVEGVYKNYYLNGKIKGFGNKACIRGNLVVYKPEGIFEGTFEIKQ